MNNSIKRSNVWLWLTLPVAVLLAIAAGGGLFIPDLYRDAPSIVQQALGQDLVSLAIVLPTLIVTAVLSIRGSLGARLIWLGALVYLVYSCAVFAFYVQFNAPFLVYVALLAGSLYALIGGLVTADKDEIKARFMASTPVKTLSIYLAVLVVLFYAMWLSEVLPALLAGEVPESIKDHGVPTNAVQVLDMAWILPAFGITAANLWRKRPLGYILAGVMLSFFVLLVSAILSMVLFMVRDGHPVSIPQVVIFGTLLVISLVLLIWYIARGSASHSRRLVTAGASHVGGAG
jgi:hypothetical protein